MTDDEKIEEAADEYLREQMDNGDLLIAIPTYDMDVFKAGVKWRDQDILTRDETKIALETIDAIASFVAMRGLWTEQVPALVKLCNYLRERSQ